ncbi:MAG: hypothetical protein ACTSVO_00725 [Candidatus Heimdallarchaeaceae archaeon]
MKEEKTFLITSKDVVELMRTIKEQIESKVRGVTYGKPEAEEYKETAKMLTRLLVNEVRKRLRENKGEKKNEEVEK